MPETRARIFEAAEKLNYRPNLMARALRTGEMHTVAMVLHPQQIASPLYGEAIATLKLALEPRQLKLMISVLGNGENPGEAVEELSGWCSIVALPGDMYESVAALTSVGIPLILLDWIGTAGTPGAGPVDTGDAAPSLSSVGFDQSAAIAQAVEHLVSIGHRNIAYIGGPRSCQNYELREAGFRAAMQQSLLSVRPEWMFLCDPTSPGDTASAASAFEQAISGSRCRLSGLICAADTLALELIAAIRRKGKQVPDDFSVIGYGDTIAARLISPQLTTIRHSGRELGEALARLVIAHYSPDEAAAGDVVLSAQLIERDTTAPRRSHITFSGRSFAQTNGPELQAAGSLLDGLYEFEARHSGMLLDVPNAARTPGCHVWQWKRNGSTAQLWHVSHVQDEWYRIRNVGSWLYLDADASVSEVCPVVTNPLDEQKPEFQLWKIEAVEPGSATYRITNRAKNLVVDFAYGSLVSNELVIVYPWNGNACQQWVGLRVPFLTDEYEIIAMHSSRALDVPGQSRAVGTVPCQSDRARTLGQRWRLIHRGAGYYQIQSMLSNLMLQASKNPIPRVILTQDDPEAGAAQHWQIEPVDAAQQSYRFISKALGSVLQIHAGQHAAGTLLEVGEWTEAPYQQWLIYDDDAE